MIAHDTALGSAIVDLLTDRAGEIVAARRNDAEGLGGLALGLALTAHDSKPRRVALHTVLSAAVSARPQPPGLFAGGAGVLCALAVAHRTTGGYERALASYRANLRPVYAALPDALGREPLSATTWDVVSGAAGLCLAAEHDEPFADAEALRHVLVGIALKPNRLLRALEAAGGEPVWDLGVAHGVWGVLAAATGASLDRVAAAALAAQAVEFIELGGPDFAAFATPRGTRLQPHNAWCYGPFGIGLVVVRLADAARRAGAPELAARLESTFERAFAAWCEQPGAARIFASHPAVCHGAAGRLLAAELLSARYTGAARDAVRREADRARDVLLHGVATAEQFLARFSDGHIGLLGGAIGAAIVVADDAAARRVLIALLGGPPVHVA